MKLEHLGLSSDSTLTSSVVSGYLLLSQPPFPLFVKWGRYSPCPQPAVSLDSDATVGISQNPGHALQTVKLGHFVLRLFQALSCGADTVWCLL